jgi:hypothetical protein
MRKEPSGSLRHGGEITGIEKVHMVFEAAAGRPSGNRSLHQRGLIREEPIRFFEAAAGIANGGMRVSAPISFLIHNEDSAGILVFSSQSLHENAQPYPVNGKLNNR